MIRNIDQVIADLRALKEDDYREGIDNIEALDRLDSLTSEVFDSQSRKKAIPVLFELIERMPDADLGSPGAIVHSLEKMPGEYESELVASIGRKPTPLTVWMVNRILNAELTEPDRKTWLNLLRGVGSHPNASDLARSQAEHFLQYQIEKG